MTILINNRIILPPPPPPKKGRCVFLQPDKSWDFRKFDMLRTDTKPEAGISPTLSACNYIV